MRLVDRLKRSIKKRDGNVILRSELARLGSPTQISEALRQLQTQGVVIRIGTGVYAKTRVSTATGSRIPAGTIETLAVEALDRMGVRTRPGEAARRYNSGETTQVPGQFILNTGSKRIRRKIALGGRRVAYENDIERRVAVA